MGINAQYRLSLLFERSSRCAGGDRLARERGRHHRKWMGRRLHDRFVSEILLRPWLIVIVCEVVAVVPPRWQMREEIDLRVEFVSLTFILFIPHSALFGASGS